MSYVSRPYVNPPPQVRKSRKKSCGRWLCENCLKKHGVIRYFRGTAIPRHQEICK